MPSEADMQELIRNNWDEGEKRLNLDCDLKAYSAQELEQLLRIIAAQKPHVEELWLGRNGIGDEGVRRVVDALPSLRHLKELYLSNNGIGDEGARRVADALPSLRHLKKLYLLYNKFGKDVAATIAEAALPFLGELEVLGLTVDPKKVDWGARGWVQGMPSAALGAAVDAGGGDWNWGPMLAVIRRMANDTPELLPQRVRERLTGNAAPSEAEAPNSTEEKEEEKEDGGGDVGGGGGEQGEMEQIWEGIKASAVAQFRYSRICLVGKGRAGKTALCLSMQGKKVEADKPLPSTVGIDNVVLQVNKTELEAGGAWREYEGGSNEMEEAAARVVCEALLRKESRESGESKESKERKESGGGGKEEVSMVEWLSKRQQEARAQDASPPPAGAAASGGDHGSRGGKEEEEMAAEEEAEAEEEEEEEEAEGEAGPVELKAGLVLAYKGRRGKARLRVSVWDFGGQEVFYVMHHLFLTNRCCYPIIFNMEWFFTKDDKEAAKRDYFLDFWMNSVVTHTWDKETETGAPILLVGTHKDKVGERVDHEAISKRLYERFSSHPAWKLLVPWEPKEGGSGLFFFPVDNTKGQEDTVVCELMATMEGTLEAQANVQKKVPLKWIAVFEELRRDPRAAITFKQLAAIAKKHSLPSSPAVPFQRELKYMASFFSGLGFIMYHDEPSLADLVVLDPPKFLIAPATKLVCKPSLHVIKEHNAARKTQAGLYEQYEQRGIVDRRLLESFWADVPPEHHQQLEVLMIKFGLLVPLISTAHAPGQYLLPALLPKARPDVPRAVAKLTCFLLFAFEDRMEGWERAGGVSLREVAEKGFCPAGVFPRLLGKGVSRMQQTSTQTVESMELAADCAHLFFGTHLFRLTNLRAQRCVRLEFLVESSAPVLTAVLAQARAVLAECIKNLHCNIGVPDDGGRAEAQYDGWQGRLVLLDGELGLWKRVERKESVWLGLGLQQELSPTRIRELFAGFLPPHLCTGLLAFYHVFLSYRWTRGLDDELVEGLFFSLSNELVHGKPLRVFWDKSRLEDGRDFQHDFAVALTHSRMIVPVVSHQALSRMKTLHPDSNIDNLLLEWTLAVALLGGAQELQACFPVMFGSEKLASDNGTFVTSLFGDSSGTRPQDLPAVRCGKLLAKVQELLTSHRGPSAAAASPAAAALTVSDTVEKITKYLGFKCWESLVLEADATAEARFKKLLIAEATKKILAVLEGMPPPTTHAPATPADAEGQVEGLLQVMAACKLEDRVGDALAWFQENQCDSVAELCYVKMEEEFVGALQLGKVKAKSLLQRLKEWSPGQ